MSIASRLSTPPAPKPSRTQIDVWLDTLDQADREAILAAAVNPEWRHVDLREALIAEGSPVVATTSFARWRETRGWVKP